MGTVEGDVTTNAERQPPPMGRKVKDRVLDAAERLFGEFGLNGVSLRQIAAAAGSKNHLAVQYHFGGQAGLARSVLERRLPSLEQGRGKLLAEVREAGRLNDLKALLDVMFRPIAYERDDDGRRSYAAFLLGVYRDPDLFTVRKDLNETAPLTNHVVGLIRDSVIGVPDVLFRQRVLCASTVYLQCIIALDGAIVQGGWLTNEADALAEAAQQ